MNKSEKVLQPNVIKNLESLLKLYSEYGANREEDNIKILKGIANEIRKDCFRMIWASKSGHPAASLSITDIITVLYFSILNIDPHNPKWVDRDRFILSKGHGCPALYSALARRGFFDCDELSTLRSLGSILQGHPDMNMTPGVEMSTGSLGIGLSVAVGKAIGGKLRQAPFFTYVLMGDGELDEGQVWEGAMAAAHYKLGSLIALVDRNFGQLDGKTKDVMSLEPLVDKWKAFGWYVMEVDGHSFEQLIFSLKLAKEIKDIPKLIICHTVKGKGVSYLEGKQELYGEGITEEQVEAAIKELEQNVFIKAGEGVSQ